MDQLVQDQAKKYRSVNGFVVSDHNGVEEPDGIGHLLPKSAKKNGLMLDLEPEGGRWLLEGTTKKYIPIGIAKNIEHARLVLKNLRTHGVNGYIVVSNKHDLPFQSDLFDLIWSYELCSFKGPAELSTFTETAHNILAKSGRIKIAVSSSRHIDADLDATQYNCSRNEYEATFAAYFSNVWSYARTCFNTLPAKSRLKHVSLLEKPKVALAMAISFLSKYFTVFSKFSDTNFIESRKIKGPQNLRIAHFLRHHWLKENLNVVYLLQCPISGGPVYLSKDSKFVISDNAGVKYPVIDEVPVMLANVAVPMSERTMSEVKVNAES